MEKYYPMALRHSQRSSILLLFIIPCWCITFATSLETSGPLMPKHWRFTTSPSVSLVGEPIQITVGGRRLLSYSTGLLRRSLCCHGAVPPT